MQTLSYQSGEVIFSQGSFATTMYEVSSGLVGIYAAYGTEGEHHLATFGPGSCFGEMGLVECYPRSATAVALEQDTTLVEVSADDFSTFYANRPEKVLSVMRQVSARLRETNEKYLEACRTAFYQV